MHTIAITGASGFIGSHLSKYLLNLDCNIVRFSGRFNSSGVDTCIPIDINAATNWDNLLTGVNCIIHLASLVHVHEPNESRYYDINTSGTLNLARQAIHSGVKRFIFISSVSVYGYKSDSMPFCPLGFTQPNSPYARSKLCAEEGLLNLARLHPDFKVVIIRPAMVYGPGAPGNFNRLLNWAKFCLPLPTASKTNLRNYLHVNNLVKLIEICINHPNAPGRIFLAADPTPHSSYDFIQYTMRSSGVNSWHIPFTKSILELALLFFKKSSIYHSLYSSFEINISGSIKLLNWNPVDFIGKNECFTSEFLGD